MNVHVDLGDGNIRLMKVSDLTPNHSVVENDHEKAHITEYLFHGKVVHRSVHTVLKKGLGIESVIGQVG